MAWHGVVTSESLRSEATVNTLQVAGASVSGAAGAVRHHYLVRVGGEELERVARELAPGPHLAHFWDGGRTLVLYPGGARFAFTAAEPELREEAVRYGSALGVPAEWLAFPHGLPGRGAAGPGGGIAGPSAGGPAELPGGVRLVLADDDLEALLDRVADDLLAAIPPGPALPAAAAAGPAFARLREALRAPEPGPLRVLAPNGRWVHQGLRLARLTPDLLDPLHALLSEAGAALLPGPDGPGRAGTVLATAAEAARSTPEALVGALARALAVIDLVPDEDTRTVSAALAASTADGREEAVLTEAEERAFGRIAHRVTMLLTESDPLHRFLTDPAAADG